MLFVYSTEVNRQVNQLRKDEVNALINRTPSFNSDQDLKRTSESERYQAPAVGVMTQSPWKGVSGGVDVQPPATVKAGLVPSEVWNDGGETPRKKPARTDSEKEEKRQRTLSLKNKLRVGYSEYKGPNELPPSEIEGFLDRKHERQSGGMKATIRSWKSYYTVLCGQLLCFFKDKQGW